MSNQASQGQQGYSTAATGYNAAAFQMRQMLEKINTAEPVTVTSVDTGARTVEVKPLVNIVDGAGKTLEQSTLYSLPYLRIQGGENALIIDPKAGDVGLAVYAMRDTESMKASPGAPVPPGSARAYDKGDGFYLGGFLNVDPPTRFIKIDDTGIELNDGAGGVITLKSGRMEITAPAGIHGTTPTFDMGGAGANATFNANMQINGRVQSTGDQTAGGISQMHHTHTGVQPGGGNTGEPNG